MTITNDSNKIIIVGDFTLFPGDQCEMDAVGPGEEALARAKAISVVPPLEMGQVSYTDKEAKPVAAKPAVAPAKAAKPAAAKPAKA